MRHFPKGFLFFFLLNKRLTKKYSFLIILGMVPLLVAGLFLAAREDSGVLHILLCQENQEDPLSEQVIRELLEKDSILRFSREASKTAACEEVRRGRADAVWIFSDGLQEGVDNYTSYREREEALVTVVEREDTVFLQLARERLYSVLYPHLSFGLFQNYISLELAEGEVSQEELRAEYQMAEVEGSIFQFSYRNSQDAVDGQADGNYLLAPLRGLLALLVLLCGLTASLYFQQDREAGLFLRLPGGGGKLFPYLYHMTAVVDAAAVVLLTFYVTGIWISWGRELPLMALYCVACVGFCNLLRKLCKTIQRLATCIPILLLAMTVLCPVFISLKHFRMVQCLFPPFYYLQSVHNTYFIKYFLVYLAVLYAVDFLVGRPGSGYHK